MPSISEPRCLPAILSVAGLLVLPACADDDDSAVQLDFARSIPALQTIEIDSGLVPVADGIEVRTVTTFEASWEFAASGVVHDDAWIEAIEGTGEIGLVGNATIELYADISRPGEEFEGLVGTQTFSVTTNIATFDPFLIDDPMLLGLDLPGEIEARFDPPSGTGLAFVVEGGVFMAPTYEGRCLEQDPQTQRAQYTMDILPVGDFKYILAAEFVTPFTRDRFAEIGIESDFGSDETAVDLGTLSTVDGSPVDGSGPCD